MSRNLLCLLVTFCLLSACQQDRQTDATDTGLVTDGGDGAVLPIDAAAADSLASEEQADTNVMPRIEEYTGPPLETGSPFEKMMGAWVSLSDEKNLIAFQPNRYISYYDGRKVVDQGLELYEKCPPACLGNSKAPLDMACLIMKGKFDNLCYSLVKLTDDELQISQLGGAGNTLTFRRVRQ